MSKDKTRILGRILAVEEMNAVSGARCTLVEYDTSCLETDPVSDSGTIADSGTTSDSGTLADSGTTADSGTAADSGTTADSGTFGDTKPVFDILIDP